MVHEFSRLHTIFVSFFFIILSRFTSMLRVFFLRVSCFKANYQQFQPLEFYFSFCSLTVFLFASKWLLIGLISLQGEEKKCSAICRLFGFMTIVKVACTKSAFYYSSLFLNWYQCCCNFSVKRKKNIYMFMLNTDGI